MVILFGGPFRVNSPGHVAEHNRLATAVPETTPAGKFLRDDGTWAPGTVSDAGVAALIPDTGTATGAALSAAFGRSTRPSYAPASSQKWYDQVRGVYNWRSDNTRRLMASLAWAQVGGFSNLLMLGDSRTDNYMGSVDGYDRRKMWPNQLRDQLVAAMPDLGQATDGFIKCGYVGAMDPRVTTTGTWTTNGDTLNSSVNGATCTIVTEKPCTNIDVYTIGTAGTWSVTVDGGAPESMTTTSFTKLSFTGLTNTAHTVVVTNATAAGTSVALFGVTAWNAAGGVVIHNTAVFGATLQHDINGWGKSAAPVTWTRAWYTQKLMNAVNLPGYGVAGGPTNGTVPDCVFIECGVNDLTSGDSISALTTALTNVRNIYPGSDFVMFIGPDPANATAHPVWPDWAAALFTLADTLDCPLIDLYARAGGNTISGPLQLLASDRLHSPLRWQKQEGRWVSQLITA